MTIKQIIKHPIAQYAVNYLIAFALMMICRIIFIASNSNFYGDIEPSHYLTLFKGGTKYDFAAIFYLTAVSFFMMIMPFRFALNATYRRVAKYFFLIPVSIGIFANIFDAAYFSFNGRRTNFSFFSEFKNESNLASIFFGGLVDYWYLALAAAALIFVLVKFYYSPKVSADDFPAKRYTLKVLPATLICIYFFMAGLRGSLFIDNDHRPMNMNNANEYIKKSNESAIVLNTPYCILRTMGKISFTNPEYFDADELSQIYRAAGTSP